MKKAGLGIVIGAAAIALAALFQTYHDLPTRVSVVETTVGDIKDDVKDIKADLHELVSRSQR